MLMPANVLSPDNTHLLLSPVTTAEINYFQFYPLAHLIGTSSRLNENVGQDGVKRKYLLN